MPQPVDISAVLPALDEAMKPFTDALKEIDALPYQARPSDLTVIGNWVTLRTLPIAQLRKVEQARQALHTISGE